MAVGLSDELIGYLSQRPQSQSPAAKLTELVTDALVFQQGRMFEGVPAVQDLRAAVQRSDAAQREHRVVYEQRGRLLSEPRQNWTEPAILGVTEDQNLPPILLLAWKRHKIQTWTWHEGAICREIDSFLYSFISAPVRLVENGSISFLHCTFTLLYFSSDLMTLFSLIDHSFTTIIFWHIYCQCAIKIFLFTPHCWPYNARFPVMFEILT